MSKPSLFVVSCDANYFDLAKETILSLRQALPAEEQAQIGFLDSGCRPEQLQWLGRHVDVIRQARWDFSFAGQEKAPEFLKGMLARALLRRYFPGFETYVWLDADTWVQDGQALRLLLQGARQRRGLAIVPEIDRGQMLLQYGGMPGFWQFAYNRYAATYDRDSANQLHHYPCLNAGVLALHRDAPHWEAWQEGIQQALKRSLGLYTDQTVLNVVVYRQFFARTEFLPAWCNWACHHGLPAWDKQRQCLVEPYLPHQPIGIFHQTYTTKEEFAVLRSTDGGMVRVRMHYPPQALPTQISGTANEDPVPISVQAVLGKAEQLLRAGDLNEMISLCRYILNVEPGTAEAHRFLGLAAFSQGRFKDALDHGKRALTLAPGNAVTHDNVSLYLNALGQHVEAEASARQALALMPSLVNAWHNLGMALGAQRKFAEAETALRQCLTLAPNNPDVWNKLAAMLEQSGRFPEAILALERALELRPSFDLASGNVRKLREHLAASAPAQVEKTHGIMRLAQKS